MEDNKCYFIINEIPEQAPDDYEAVYTDCTECEAG